MNKFNLVLLLIAFAFTNAQSDRSDISMEYEKCESRSEKRVDIHDSSAVYSDKLKPFSFVNFDKLTNWTYSPSDELSFEPLPESKLEITGSNFSDAYELWKMYFVINQNDNQGRKHVIDDNKFPLELRLVSYQPSTKSFSVLGFFFTESKEDNPSLKSILDIISLKNATTVDFKLSSILPSTDKLANYYRYDGKSLNSTTCVDEIKWTLFEQTIPISKSQLSVFPAPVPTKTGRNTQKVNVREVFSSKKERRQAPKAGEDKVTKVQGTNSANEYARYSFAALIATLGLNLVLL